MERLSDVLSSVKERVTNPFLLSLLIAFSFHNWRIVVALFWWDNQQIYATGNLTIFDFIQSELNKEGSIKIPIFYALGYAIVAPYIFSVFSIVGAWAIKFGNTFIIKNSENTPISFAKFMQLKKKHKKIQDEFSQLLTTESETQRQLEIKKQELADSLERYNKSELENASKLKAIEESLKLTEEKSKNELRIIAERNDVLTKTTDDLKKTVSESKNINIIKGRWSLFGIDELSNSEVIISEGQFSIRGNKEIDTYMIKNFHYNKTDQHIEFSIISTEYPEKMNRFSQFLSLRLNTVKDVLTGTMDRNSITLRLIK